MKLRNMFKKFSTKTKAILAGVGVAAVIAPIAVLAEFYPVRPVFDYNKMPVNGTTCTVADKDALNRCGSMTGPVFNSFINTPSAGDERAFLDGRRSDQAANTNADQINDVTKGSKEVILRTYVHNNANQNTNASGLGVATGAKVKLKVPTGTSQVLRVASIISANNATAVEDTADMVGTQQFSVSYVPGSAKLLRGTSQYALSDNIVTTGALIGDKTMNGNLPGCFDYAALVEIRVRVQVANYNLDLTKQVRKHVEGQTGNWSKEVSVPAGTKVDYVLNTKNAGTSILKDVTTRDALPPHMQLVPGTVKYINARGSAFQNDAPLFAGGINGGQYNPGDDTLITFSAVTKGDFEACSVKVRNVAYAKSSTTPEIYDDAIVTITKPNCNPTPKNPGVSIDKKVDGIEKKTVNVNQEFNYQLVVRNTGDVNLTNVKVSDVAPANVQFISTDKGSVVGNKLTYTIPALAVGASVNINIKAKVIAEVDGDIVNTACVNAPEVNPNNPNEEDDCDDATVNVPGAVYSCDLLTSSKIGDFKFRFNTLVTARNGATFKNLTYSFGDGTAVTTADKTVEHQYAQEGTYQVRANATFTVRGKDFTVTSPACATQVTITKKPVTPVYSCDGLTSEKIGDRQYRFTVGFTARDGANLKLVKFNYGDGSEVYTTNTPVASHTFAKDGTFVTRAVLTFSVDGQDKVVDSDKCAVPVTLTSVPPTTPGTPTVLPNTGAGNMFGIFTAVTMAGAFMHRAYASRKATSL